MTITLEINGKKIPATVDDKLVQGILHPSTGYEVPTHRCEHAWTEVAKLEDGVYSNKCCYICTNSIVGEDNARADRLMTNLRKFAAEHGGCVAGRRKTLGTGYVIEMPGLEIRVREVFGYGMLGVIAFATYEAAQQAVEKFKDELLWYFKNYDPMPEGWWGD